MKKKTKLKIVDISIMLIIVASCITLGYLIGENPDIKDRLSNEIYKIDNINMCENKTISQTSECLRDYVSTFYNYTIRNDTIKTLEDIKESGGDCFDYTNIYKSGLETLGFNTKVDSIYPDNKTRAGHTFLISWDKNMTEYCKLDLLEVDCLEFKKK